MSWRIEVKPSAEKQYLKLDRKTRGKIRKALARLQGSESFALQPHVKALSGKLRGDYRLRVGEWRVLFQPDKSGRILHVYAIIPRGKGY